MMNSQSTGPQVPDVISSSRICDQDLNIGIKKAVSSGFFVFNRGYTNPFLHERGGNIIEKLQDPLQTRAGKKNHRKFSHDGIVKENNGLLPSRNNGHQRQPRQPIEKFSGCSEQEEPDLHSISCFRNLSAQSLQLVLQEKQTSYSQLRDATRVTYTREGTSVSSAEASNVCFGSNIGSMRTDPHKVHGLSRDTDKNLRSGKEEKVLSMFTNLNGNLPKQETHPASYIKAYNLLLRDGRLRECVDLLETMERNGLLDMEKVHHISFLNACKDQKAVHEAFRFCRLIRNPTMSTFNILLSVCASSQDFEGAFQVMLLIKEAGLTPDCKLYTTLISTCAKSGKVDAMFEVFHEMVNAGIEPNVKTYGALIDGCARAGQVAKAFGAYGIMSSKKVQPDRVVFNALITACGESGAVDRAFDVLAEMKTEPKPIEPDHVTVGALMKACNKAGQVDRTREVYNMLQEYNIRGTPEVYTIAVRSCSQIGDLNFALKIYDDMKKNGVSPDEMFLSTLIDVAGHAGKVDAGFKILQDARAEGIKVGNMSYSSLMGACCNAKNWKKALELYEEIKEMKLLPTVSMLNALVTSLCEGNQVRKSIEVINEVKKLGVRTNVITYSVLIVACEKNEEAELGFTIFSEAKKDNVLPNLIMCRCLTGLCLQSFKKAYSLGELVINFRSGRPQIDCKWTSMAIQVYRETVQAGIKPSIEVFSQVLGCFQLPHDCSLRDIYNENLGLSPDASKFSNRSSLLDGFGEYDTRCFSILEDAITLGVIHRISFKDGPIVLDARKLLVHIAEVYLLTILKGLKHRLAAGAKLPNITILLPTEKTEIEFAKGETTISVAGRVGQAVGSLLRRIRLPYQGDESYGKIRITGLTLKRWFKPKLSTTLPFAGRYAEMITNPTRLAKGIMDQRRNIRSPSLD